MKKYIIILCAVLTAQINAQFKKAELDEFFNALEQNDKFNGSVALSKDGQIIYERALGFADYENQQKNNTETRFRIGSISKTFTATLIMKAVEESKLKLDQKLSKYFPDIKNADKITLENLLNHRSGIYNFTNDPKYLSWNTQPKSESEMLEIISGYNNAFEPGSRAEYSNSNYILLSYILEKTHNKPYAEILNESIILPLDLKDTYIGNGIDSKENEAYSYKYTGSWIKQPETDVSVPLGAGAISSTPSDIIRFGEALFNGSLVSNESLKAMEEIKDGYGYGLFEFPFNDKRALGHTGGIDGFASMWGYFPNEKVSVALISNGADFVTNDIAIALLSAVFDQPIHIPKFKTSNADIIPGYTGEFHNGQIGMTIKITENDGQYIAQATGQMPFPLEKVSDKKFKFEMGGIVIEYADDLKSLKLLQGGGEFVFMKQ